jgi:hypothetical protein
MKKIIFVFLTSLSGLAGAQELYVFSEPASNMPARSISTKFTHHFTGKDEIYNRSAHRLMPELMFGFSKNLMVHLTSTFANMHTTDFRFESAGLYAKYRFLSFDELHKHFRMAVFADGTISRVPFHYDEVSLMGDKSGVELGLIATQLWNKLALSGTLSHTQLTHSSRKSNVFYIPERDYSSLNYSLSGGYLLFPRNYTDYRQTNVNLYVELLGQRTFGAGRFYVDVAPAIQLIFNSNLKLNLGRRMQLDSDMTRMSENTWLISLERTFLNAF